MPNTYSNRTTVSYLQWVADDLEMARNCFNNTNLEDKNASGLITEALEGINCGIRSYELKMPSSKNDVKVSVMVAEEAIRAVHFLAHRHRNVEWSAAYRSLIQKSCAALAYLKTSNGWA